MNHVTPFTTRAVEHLLHAKRTAVQVEIATIALLVAVLVEMEILRVVRPRAGYRLSLEITAGILLVAFAAVVVSRALALR